MAVNWLLRKRVNRPPARPKTIDTRGLAERTSLSIGICAYNEALRLPALLESLASQSLPAGFVVDEILVVASGCTDGTERLVEHWAEIEPRVTLIREPERRGKASALNAILP